MRSLMRRCRACLACLAWLAGLLVNLHQHEMYIVNPLHALQYNQHLIGLVFTKSSLPHIPAPLRLRADVR